MAQNVGHFFVLSYAPTPKKTRRVLYVLAGRRITVSAKSRLTTSLLTERKIISCYKFCSVFPVLAPLDSKPNFSELNFCWSLACWIFPWRSSPADSTASTAD